jgi:hypothetical protein
MQRWAEPIYTGDRRLGPEADVEDAVVTALGDLLPLRLRPSCVFGSRPVGAGAPDLTVLYHARDVHAPVEGPDSMVDILAYLRVVNQARAETLCDRLGLNQRVLEGCIEVLVGAGVIRCQGARFVLERCYRDPLREVVAIEVKVSKWHDAVSQAARNRVFAHRSFVALPERQARLARDDERVARLGIGVIAVAGSTATVVRRSRRSQPRVWRYYFDLFLASARHARGMDALLSSHRGSEEVIPSV